MTRVPKWHGQLHIALRKSGSRPQSSCKRCFAAQDQFSCFFTELCLTVAEAKETKDQTKEDGARKGRETGRKSMTKRRAGLE